MSIEAVLPALAPESSVQAADVQRRDPFQRHRRDGGPPGLIPWAGYALSAWDVMSGTHRHVCLASEGYSDAHMAHLDDSFITSNPGFAISHTRALGALRWRDYALEWNLRFSETQTAREFLVPAGFREGTTMCLRLPDGRYTGSLHVSWSSPGDATDESRTVIERFRPLLATVCDMLRGARLAADRLDPDAHAVLVTRDGRVVPMPGKREGAVLSDSPFRRALSEAPRHLLDRGYLWIDAEGRCRRIETVPCHGGVTMVTERMVPWPFGVTAREAQVLHLIATGLSNPEIASRPSHQYADGIHARRTHPGQTRLLIPRRARSGRCP